MRIVLALLLFTTAALAGEHDHCATTSAGTAGTEHVTAWVPADRRTPLKNLDIGFRDHGGREGMLAKIVDKPVVVTFFYSRCQNSRKCSMAVSHLGGLQRQLAEAGIDRQVRLLAISYEPQFDTPDRLHRYATDRGFALTENAMALQLDAGRNQRFVEELNAPANYNAGWINTHGVELNLLDAQGRLVRKYHTVLWDNAQVVADLKRVLEEK